MSNRFFIAGVLFLLFLLTQAVFAQESTDTIRVTIATINDDGQKSVESTTIITPDMIQVGPGGERFVEIDGQKVSLDGEGFESVSTVHFEPPPSTMLRLIPTVEEANREGKALFFHIIAAGEDDLKLIDELLGISEAQRLHLQARDEEIGKRFEELEEAPEDDSPEAFATWENKTLAFFSQAFDEIDATIRETLTPSQLQALREYDLANPLEIVEEMHGINFDAYEALDLSEEQREQLQKMMEEEAAQSQKELEELEKLSSDPEKMMEKFVERMENPEKWKARAAKVRERILNILTPEQRERLTALKEEIPKKLAGIKAKQESESPKDGEPWKPGKDSWKPGDPIPDDFVPPPQPRRFPIGR